MITFDHVGGCHAPATRTIEAYTPAGEHASLDATVAACENHHQVWRECITASRMTAYMLPDCAFGKVCGDRTVFDPCQLTADHPGTPRPAVTPRTAPAAPEPEPVAGGFVVGQHVRVRGVSGHLADRPELVGRTGWIVAEARDGSLNVLGLTGKPAETYADMCGFRPEELEEATCLLCKRRIVGAIEGDYCSDSCELADNPSRDDEDDEL